MSFPRYAKYKDSRVEWLGQVPAHWNMGRCGFYCFILSGFAFPSSGFSLSADHTRLLRGINVGVGRLRWDEVVFWERQPSDGLDAFALVEGDIVVGMDRPIIAEGMRIAQVTAQDLPCLLLQRVACVRPSNQLLRSFVVRLLSADAFAHHVAPETTGVSVPHISPEQISSYQVPIPPMEEQASIVAFLDRETAKIDALVTEQERLIELLNEKRQAVIAHAVTKGLNPHAPMKPSGVEWLGEIPAHWEVKRLKYLARAIIGLTFSPDDLVDEATGTLVLRSSNVQNGAITFDDTVYVSSSVPEELVTQVRDILVCSRNGSRALIGKNAMIDERSAGMTFGAFMTIVRSPYNDYLACVLNSPLFERQSGSFQTSTINQLTVGTLNSFQIAFPPERERAEIVTVVRAEGARTDALVAEAQRTIDLLRERRAALISAAVTGQIDVRGAARSAA